MKKRFIKYLRYLLLKWWPNYFSWKLHRYEKKYLDLLASNTKDSGDEILNEAGIVTDTIIGGPFIGMKYSGQAICSTKPPKIIGSYEEELSSFIEDFISQDLKKVINIGAAEGYYAIGFALRIPEVEILAIDPSPRSKKSIELNAELNNVSTRVKFEYRASFNALRKEIIENKTLFLVDCEGSEIGYMNINRLPSLKYAAFIIETHDFVYPRITEELNKRFLPTHDVTIVNQEKRQQENYPILNNIQSALAKQIMSEKRPESIKWLVGIPKTW